jgi:hypothetical protein
VKRGRPSCHPLFRFYLAPIFLSRFLLRNHPAPDNVTFSSDPAMNPVIEAVRQGSVPKPAKLAAARAMLPMTPEDSLEVLVLLARDEDEEIRGAATKSLNEFNKDQMKVVVSNKETAKDVLAHLCAWRRRCRSGQMAS